MKFSCVSWIRSDVSKYFHPYVISNKSKKLSLFCVNKTSSFRVLKIYKRPKDAHVWHVHICAYEIPLHLDYWFM